MSFRYIVETVNKNGAKERSVQDIAKSEILLGRGTASDILLSGARVSLNHTKIFLRDDGRLYFEDLGSLSGVMVNRRILKHGELKRGDILQIGSYTFEIIKDDEGFGFLEKRDASETADSLEELLDEQVRKLRFQTYMPSSLVLSSVISAVVLVLFGVIPLSGASRGSWNSGPISNQHKMIENDCEQCHATPFKQAQDAQCIACHTMSDHAKNISTVFEKHPKLNMRCAQCHMEHNGDEGLIAKESKLCTECHGKLGDLLNDTAVAAIPNFTKHPEFRVTLFVAAEEAGAKPLRVSLKEKGELKDPTQIKLNHQIHLKEGLAGANGPVNMQCVDCHRFSEDFKIIKPIKFERDCSSCHNLEFDPRLAGRSVPHGDPDVVFNYLYAEYAKLFLDTAGESDPIDDLARKRKPGQAVERGEKIQFSKEAIEKQSRTVEDSLFNRTACYLCHVVAKKEGGGNDASMAGMSNYTVLPPHIPERWMPGARFDHGAHQEVACESCHLGVRNSSETTDVLLPGVENCRQCHAEGTQSSGRFTVSGAPKGRVRAECIVCHSYHDTLQMKEEKKRDIEKILLSMNKKNLLSGPERERLRAVF